MTGAGVDRLDDVRRDHVVAVFTARQHVSPIVHLQMDVRLIQHVVIDVREIARGLTDAVGEFDDVQLDRMLARCARGDAAAEADDEDGFRIATQHHREMAEPRMSALRLWRFAGTRRRPEKTYSAAQTIRLTRLPNRGSSRKPASVDPRIAPSTLTEYSVPRRCATSREP